MPSLPGIRLTLTGRTDVTRNLMTDICLESQTKKLGDSVSKLKIQQTVVTTTFSYGQVNIKFHDISLI